MLGDNDPQNMPQNMKGVPDVSAPVLSIEKRRNAGEQKSEETKAISVLCLNEIVGSEVGYNSEYSHV
ncbi:hypothetical protein ABKV19_027668 [Rosa sericea]